MEQRVSKHNYYLDIAQTVAERSTCLRRKFGAIIVRNDAIISTGYNGAPRGRKNCDDMGFCMRAHLNIPGASGTSCADPSTRRLTRSSMPRVTRCWARRCT